MASNPINPDPISVDPDPVETSGIETIGGHQYFVTRDAKGNIVKQEARDESTVVGIQIVPTVSVAQAQGLVSVKDPKTATLTDVYSLLVYLAGKELIKQ